MAACEVWSFYSAPSDEDVFALADLLEEDPTAEQRFSSLCAERGIDRSDAFDADAASGDAATAAAFLDSEWGAKLVSVKLPKLAADAVEAYATIIELARSRGLVVHDPQLGEDIDLAVPGVLPPRWA